MPSRGKFQSKEAGVDYKSNLVRISLSEWITCWFFELLVPHSIKHRKKLRKWGTKGLRKIIVFVELLLRTYFFVSKN